VFAGREPKRSTNVPAIEERRLVFTPGEGSGGELRSDEDIFLTVGCIGYRGVRFVRGGSGSSLLIEASLIV
jgi:hypothetical protein